MADRIPNDKRARRPFPKGKRKRPGNELSGANNIPINGSASGEGFPSKGKANNNNSNNNGNALSPEERNKLRRQKKAEKRRERDKEASADLDLVAGLNRAVAAMDPFLLADYVAKQTRRFGRQLSPIELDDLRIPASAIVDTTTYTDDRTLDKLPVFLEQFCGGHDRLVTAPKANGAPHTIVVTGAGLRSADLVRALRSFQTPKNTISKLFAKHIKIEESVAFLKSHRTGMAVGTPARLIALLEEGALSVANLRHLVVDASHIDLKKRGVLDMADTALPVVRWLARPEFKPRYDAGAELAANGDVDATAAPLPLSILFY